MGRIILPLYTPRYVPNGGEVAVIQTSRGVIRVRLAGKDAPVTVGNFIELAARGFYDGLKFHACKPGSIVVGGCPTTRTLGPAQVEAAARGIIRGIHPGTGDARYTIVDEWETNPHNRHLRGSLCLAHKSAPNSGSCQFYFSLAEQPQFDDKFTVFGHVVEGLDAMDALSVGDAIESIRIEGADEEALAARSPRRRRLRRSSAPVPSAPLLPRRRTRFAKPRFARLSENDRGRMPQTEGRSASRSAACVQPWRSAVAQTFLRRRLPMRRGARKGPWAREASSLALVGCLGARRGVSVLLRAPLTPTRTFPRGR